MTAYVVDSLADTVAADGRLTLREAIRAANTNAAVNEAAAGQGGGRTDTISFAASVAGGTVTLGGDPLEITDHLVVGGPVTVDADGRSRVFAVSGAAVAMTGLTVTGGRVVGVGGGILVAGNGALTLTACRLTANAAVFGMLDEITAEGGGVANVFGSLTLVGCGVTGNEGASAVYGVEGPLSVSGSVIADNGGGVTALSSLDIRDTAVRDNRGTGISCGLTLTAAGCAVTGNATVGIAAGGGGTVAGCAVGGNGMTGILGHGGLAVSGCAVAGNGWIGIEFGGDGLTVSDTAVTGNFGGGIAAGGAVAVINSTVSGNLSVSGVGGVTVTFGTGTLRNVSVFGNRADADGRASGVPGEDGAGGVSGGSGRGAASVTLYNTLVAGNVRGAGAAATPSDLFAFPEWSLGSNYRPASTFAGGHNLIGDAASAGGFADGAFGNVVGAGWRAVLDPAPRDNGGPTVTHALVAGSPAIDAGSDSAALGAGGHLVVDQRGPGFLRIRGARVDIGAYEVPWRDGLIAYAADGGEWLVAASDGSRFATSVWSGWRDASWTALAEGDFDGDLRSDVVGLTEGAWFVGLSTGSSFGFERWGVWRDVAWGHVLVGDLNGDAKDDVLAEVGGQWWGALSTGVGFGTPTKWAGTADAVWDFAALADMTGDGKDDLVLMIDGEWYVAASGGAAAFAPARLWERWADAAWTIRLGDFNRDGRADVVGLLRGEWYLGMSTGIGLVTVLRARWADADWADPVVGDFDGLGWDDVAARLDGEWWVGLSATSGYEESRRRWATWRDVAWDHVRVGDFDGDGLDDVAALALDGWYVARSTGATLATAKWSGPAGRRYRAVFAADPRGPDAAPAALGTSAPVMTTAEDDLLKDFWSRSEEDEAFAGLLAVV